MTCRITGIVRTPDGALFKNGTITFYRQSSVGSITDGSDSFVVIPEKVKATTNSAGEIDTTLTYGSYRATAEGVERSWPFLVGVPNTASASFYECVDLVPELSDTISGAVLGYKNDAETAATTATTKASEASASATNASGAATLSQKWAANPENTEVSGGLYSALHYAAKADASATAANAAALTADVHKDTFTALDAATDIISGQVVRVRDGENGKPEDGLTVPAATYTADGSLVRDLPGSGLQWVSYRREMASFDEFDGDTRPLADGTLLSCAAIGATWEIVPSGEHFTTTGGRKVKVVPFWVGATAGIINVTWLGAKVDGATDDTAVFQAAMDIGGDIMIPPGRMLTGPVIGRVAGTRVFGAGWASTAIVSNSDFTTLHNPTIWFPYDNCSVDGVKFTYDGWNETGFASLLGTRPSGNSYYGCHVCFGYTELYTAASSGVYNSFRGETLQVVRGAKVKNTLVVGAAVHALVFLNCVGWEASDNILNQFKGTGVYGFISPQAVVKNNNFSSSGDDLVFIGAQTSYLGGVWTPLTADEMVDVAVEGNIGVKGGAKGFNVCGFDGVRVCNNFARETRAAFIFCGTEPVFGAAASTNVECHGNTGIDIFGGFGSGADGYRYSTDIVTASGGGIFHAVTLDGCDAVSYSQNTVSRSPKVSGGGTRGFFGLGDITNLTAHSNSWRGFSRNNIGPESATADTTQNVSFKSNVVDAQSSELARLIHVGHSATDVKLDGNHYASASAINSSYAAIWFGANSECIVGAETFDLSGGLDRFNTSEGPASIKSTENTVAKASGAITITVDPQTNLVTCNDTSATSVTSIVGGVEGQKISVRCNTGNTTFVNGASLQTLSAFNTRGTLTAAAGTTHRFVNVGGGAWAMEC